MNTEQGYLLVVEDDPDIRRLLDTTLTIKGQVTIPKRIRDALGLTPGTLIDFAVNHDGEVVLHKAAGPRGKADVPWRTQDLMALLRG